MCAWFPGRAWAAGCALPWAARRDPASGPAGGSGVRSQPRAPREATALLQHGDLLPPGGSVPAPPGRRAAGRGGHGELALPVNGAGRRSLVITQRANCPSLNFRRPSEEERRRQVVSGAGAPGPARVKCSPVPCRPACRQLAFRERPKSLPGTREVHRASQGGPHRSPPPSPPAGGGSKWGAPAWRRGAGGGGQRGQGLRGRRDGR